MINYEKATRGLGKNASVILGQIEKAKANVTVDAKYLSAATGLELSIIEDILASLVWRKLVVKYNEDYELSI